jgi:multidrug efflux system membrane fusion protein
MLITLDNQIDNTTGTSKLKAVFDNKDNALFPQQFVNIRLLVDTLANQLVVPNVAVQNGQQGTFVYVVDDDSRVHLKPVKVGITTETSADIVSGISEGDRVVIDGTDRLIEGAVVRVRKAGEMDNPPGYDPGGGGRGRGGKGKGDGKSKRGDGSSQDGQSGGARLDHPSLDAAGGGTGRSGHDASKIGKGKGEGGKGEGRQGRRRGAGR